jgi:hypothetical protein
VRPPKPRENGAVRPAVLVFLALLLLSIVLTVLTGHFFLFLVLPLAVLRFRRKRRPDEPAE